MARRRDCRGFLLIRVGSSRDSEDLVGFAAPQVQEAQGAGVLPPLQGRQCAFYSHGIGADSAFKRLWWAYQELAGTTLDDASPGPQSGRRPQKPSVVNRPEGDSEHCRDQTVTCSGEPGMLRRLARTPSKTHSDRSIGVSMDKKKRQPGDQLEGCREFQDYLINWDSLLRRKDPCTHRNAAPPRRARRIAGGTLTVISG